MTITIGVHVSNPSLYHLARLPFTASIGEEVRFHHFKDGTTTAGLLADGTIDISGTGSTPPLSGQAAGHDIVYAAVSAPRPDHGALLVAADSPIRSVADLRGRTVRLAIGSWHTHLVAKALHQAGLSYADITAVREGEADAWVAQEAGLAAALRRGGVRKLIETGDVITDRSVFFARRDFAENRPEALAAVVGALQQADTWVAGHLDEAAKHAAAELGGEEQDWRTALAGLPWKLQPVTDEVIAEQQEAADILAAGGFLARPITVADAYLPALAATVAKAL
ncbi:ABC transporter substrate-binding protein [Actinoplanes couchii]|uniref:Sulfonate ABC transporter substrate-binding protein n=1 Tax=Actinoplanes couchii TaxID=403638 RepID=A0ABQ3XNG3_9ACTN|nr:ABC transporter substrate-binding protein [Actinoplanes couchii]MDR6318028.1 sulfonate transport system substrate-binding protein [Actinoplanes couchii]GID60055.1 sulfonate ABC transporter substrate-binding protein [Actinoplanes couchii]